MDSQELTFSKCCKAPIIDDVEYKYGQLSKFFVCSDCNEIFETYYNKSVNKQEEITMDNELAVVNHEIIPQQNEIRSIEETVKSAEKYVDALGKIRLLAIKLTNNLDWSNQGGKPYLEKSGCDKIAGAFGVKIFNVTFEKETNRDDAGDYIIYTCSGEGRWNNHEESEIGTCSTRDDFFGKKGGNYKPLSEVDLTDIKKKAFTNFANRLIKKLVGLSFSWEEIAQLSGNKITQATVSKVEFGQGAKGGNTDSPETKKLRDECRTWLLKLNNNDSDSAKNMLIEQTSFTNKDGEAIAGKDHITKLSEKQVQILHGKLKKMIADYDALIGGQNKNA